jgi:biopolymer transport protein ExbD
LGKIEMKNQINGSTMMDNQRVLLAQKKPAHRGMITVTSLIDIMTILLIFLIYNISDEALTDLSSTDLSLPHSFSSERSQEVSSTVVVAAGKAGVVVDNNPVMTTDKLRASPVGIVPEIYGALDAHRDAEMRMVASEFQNEVSTSVKLLGDEDLVFADMLKIMRTCSEVGYEHVFLGAIPGE